MCQNRNRRFYENELLLYTRCSFSKISAPKIYPKIDEQNDRKIEHFFGPFLDGLGSHSVTILGSKSHLKIDQKINAILDRFLNDLGPFLGSRWVPCGLRDATGTPCDAPRRSQEAPKMLPRRSRTRISRPLGDIPTPEHLWACLLASKYHACHAEYHACHTEYDACQS